MDLSLVQANTYELPTSQRVGVIVHDGTTDLRLWPGPGPDRELLSAYGPDLPRVLESERNRAGGAIAEGQLLRIIPGRLHCDFMLWVATRPPESRGTQAPAPGREMIERAVSAVLEYVRERNVISIAFPALGAGPGQLDDAERLAIVARACTKHYEANLGAGRSTTVEEIVLSDPRLSVVTGARRLVGQIAKLAVEPPPAKIASAPRAKSSGERAPSAAKRGQIRLDPGEVQRARVVARPWDRAVKYGENDFFIHAKFGVGKVVSLTPDGFIVCLFEDGETRKLIHARA
jgi:O-acetyl-ADP-ribose deacetylase (regulator of RNase III)